MPPHDRSAVVVPESLRAARRGCAVVVAAALAWGVVATPAAARGMDAAAAAQQVGTSPDTEAAGHAAVVRPGRAGSAPATPRRAVRLAADGGVQAVASVGRDRSGAPRDGGPPRSAGAVAQPPASGALLLSFLALLVGIVMRRQ